VLDPTAERAGTPRLGRQDPGAEVSLDAAATPARGSGGMRPAREPMCLVAFYGLHRRSTRVVSAASWWRRARPTKARAHQGGGEAACLFLVSTA
jgi:hypothetical protein